MKTVACPDCRTVNQNVEAASVCQSCGRPLAEALLEQSIADLRAATLKLGELTAPRKSFYTFNGFGTTLLDYRPRAGGDWEATRWVVALFVPLVPLSDYVIRPKSQERSYGREVSRFEVLDKIPLSAGRVVRVYLLVAAGLLPIILGSLNSTWVNRALGGPKAFFAMLALVAWAAYVILFKIKNEHKAYKQAGKAAQDGEPLNSY
jgi:hypothetical protein